MLLDATLCPLRKRLVQQKVSVDAVFQMGRFPSSLEQQVGTVGTTFAISLQLFPASLICFSRCSSAGVQGVLVRLFLGRGSGAGASTSPPDAAGAAPACALTGAAAAAAVAMWSCGWARLTLLRFRAFPGVGGGWAAVGFDSDADVVAGWRLGSSAGGASWALCCCCCGWGGLAAMGEGFRLRLEAGEVL